MIRNLLKGSRLAHIPKTADGAEEERTISEDKGQLRQDRYPLRTAPQFLGPQIEDILSALERIRIECNSSAWTDLLHGDKFLISNALVCSDRQSAGGPC
jgi:phenylalanine ammonia-lyase